jgi:hypothetical protein
VASAKDIFEQARKERGEDGDADAEPGADGEATGGDPAAGQEGDWEQSNEIPGGGSDPQTADAADGETGTAGSSGDEELDRALEGFDGAILAERQIILARSNETAGTRERPSDAMEGMGGSTTMGGVPGQPPFGDNSAGGGMPEPGTLPGPRSVGAPLPPSGATAAAIEVPEDLPDARDDDIVARQLREAAMNESDPVLREKLWEEYRTYKSGS